MPLAEDAPDVFIFSSKHARQRQPLDGASAAGMGMTCGSSAHQHPLSCLQVIGALHWEQWVSTGKVCRDRRRASSARQLGARGAGGFLVSGAKRVLSWVFAGGSRNTQGRCISCSCNHLREIRTLDAHTGYPSI
jgi:hypothetical protein